MYIFFFGAKLGIVINEIIVYIIYNKISNRLSQSADKIVAIILLFFAYIVLYFFVKLLSFLDFI